MTTVQPSRRLPHDLEARQPPGRGPLRARFLTRAAAGLLVVAGSILAASNLGAYLVVRDPLRSAQAIVVLAGGFPTREWEAADLFRAGWAPRVVLVREWLDHPERRATGKEPTLDDRRALLVHLGVPESAIVVAGETACMTADELVAASRTLAGADLPVILVTSKYHARRVALLWRAAAPNGPPGLVRPASGDPFTPTTWFLVRRFVVRVAREYVGLASAMLPLPARTPPCGEDFARLARLLDRLVN